MRVNINQVIGMSSTVTVGYLDSSARTQFKKYMELAQLKGPGTVLLDMGWGQ